MKKIIFMLLLMLSSLTTFGKPSLHECDSSSKSDAKFFQPPTPTGLHIVALDHYKVTFAWDYADQLAGWEVWTSQTIWGGPGYFTTDNQFSIWFDQAWWNLPGSYFRVALRARGLNGDHSNLSDHIVINIPADAPPTVPQNLRIDEIDHYHVKISWDPVYDDSACIKGFPIWTSQTVWGGSDKYSTTNSYTIFFDDSWYALQGQYFRFALQAEDCVGNKSALSNHVVVNIPSGLPRLTLTSYPANCANSNSGTIAVTIPSYANGDYSLILDNQIVISAPFAGNTYYFYNVSPGNHTVRIRNRVDFSPPPPIYPQDIYNVFVNSPAPINVIANITSNSISLSTTGGSGTYYHSLNGGFAQTISYFTGLLPNTNYYITTFDSNGCAVSNVFRTLGVNNSGPKDDTVKKEATFENFKFFPNKMSDQLTVSNNKTIQNITIVSSLGQVMLEQEVNDSETTFEVTKLPKGVYFARITSEGQEKIVRLVKE